MSFNYEHSIQQGDYETALKEILSSIEKDPDNPAHYINGGHVIFYVGKVEVANNFLIKANELDKNKSEDYYKLKNMYFSEGKYKDERTLLLSVYDKMSDDKDINKLLAITHDNE